MTTLLAFLAILAVEAFATFLWIFFTPSETGQGIFLWLSRERLVLTAAMLAVLAALLYATLRLWRDKEAASKLRDRLDSWLLDQHQLVPVRLGLLLLITVVFVAPAAVLITPREYAAYETLAPDTFPLLLSITQALLPVLVFIELACFEAAIFLRVRYPNARTSRETWDWATVGPALVLMLAALLTVFHWLTLVFQLRFLVNIPAWYWIFEPVPFGSGDVWFLLGAFLLIGLSYWALIVKERVVAGLLCLVALGWFLQMGLGLMGGRGLLTLRERYFTSYHQSYVLKARANDLSILSYVRAYEETEGWSPFTSTKPPGLMAFYIGLEQLVNGYPPEFRTPERYERLANAVIVLFPVLALSLPLILYAWARRFADDGSGVVARVAPWLYVLTPSVALFTFFADQAIYPAVFLLGVWVTVLVIDRGSIVGALLLGALLYGAAFFAFTLLPLYPFAGLYLALKVGRSSPALPLRRALMMALAIAAGTAVMYFLGLVVLNYDFFARFERTMFINHNFDFYMRVGEQPTGVAEPLGVRLAQIANAAWVNNLDFAAAIGFPVYVFFVAQAVRRVWRFAKGRARSAGDAILLALLGSFLLLNLVGSAQGEVPRLWLFWVPMVVLLAAFELQSHVQRRPQIVLALGLMQLITLMLTFHFQDLRM